MGCPCKQNQKQNIPSRVKENRQAPTPVRRLGTIRRIHRSMK